MEMTGIIDTMRVAANSNNCCETASKGRNKVTLNPAEKDEFKCLLKDARSIAAGATLPIVLKVFRFFLDEGSLIVLIYMLFNITSWEKAGIPLIINIITSIIIAYSVCNEKREVCAARQGENCASLTYEILCKTCSLMFNWFNDLSTRSTKREAKIDLIEANTFQDDNHEFWLNRKALLNLTKFYSSHLRYLREDILVITLRSFCLSIFYLLTLVDTMNLALPMCRFFDVMRLLFLVWIILNTSYIAKNFHDAKKQYIATLQLWASSWARNNPDSQINTSVVIPEYKRFRDFECNFGVKYLSKLPYIMDLLIYAVLIAARYLVIILLLVSTNLVGVGIWYALVMLVNLFLLDLLRWNFRINICNEFDYAPVGFSRKSHKWIDRFVTNIFFNYSYSPNGFNGLLKWKTVFNIPSTIIFLIIYFTEGNFKIMYPTEHDLTNTTLGYKFNNASLLYMDIPASMALSQRSQTCSMSPYVADQNVSFKGFEGLVLGSKNCIDRQLSLNPINTMDYFGGVEFGALVVLLLLMISFILETVQKYLQKCRNIKLDTFEIFPLFDATNCYRSLMKNTVKNSILNIANVANESSSILMILTLLDASQFETAWSLFGDFEQWNCENSFSQFCEEKSAQYTDNIWNYVRYINNEPTTLRSQNLVSSNINNTSSDEEEQLVTCASRLIKRFFNIDHPLEPHKNNHELIGNQHLLSKLFDCIQSRTDEELKKRDLKLFIAFLKVLDTRLCQMTSYRIQRTFDMLRIEISKTYEDVNDF